MYIHQVERTWRVKRKEDNSDLLFLICMNVVNVFCGLYLITQIHHFLVHKWGFSVLSTAAIWSVLLLEFVVILLFLSFWKTCFSGWRSLSLARREPPLDTTFLVVVKRRGGLTYLILLYYVLFSVSISSYEIIHGSITI